MRCRFSDEMVGHACRNAAGSGLLVVARPGTALGFPSTESPQIEETPKIESSDPANAVRLEHRTYVGGRGCGTDGTR